MPYIDQPIIEFKKVSKSFGDLEVLKEIDLKIYPGEIVAVIGPSGSGKTTMARMLMLWKNPLRERSW